MNEVWKTIEEMKTYEVSNFGSIIRKLKDGYKYLK